MKNTQSNMSHIFRNLLFSEGVRNFKNVFILRDKSPRERSILRKPETPFILRRIYTVCISNKKKWYVESIIFNAVIFNTFLWVLFYINNTTNRIRINDVE